METQTKTKHPKRIYIAIAGICLQVILGSVYAWSVFKKPFMDLTGWSAPSVGLAFSILIGCLGLAAAFGGKLVDRAGSRKVAILSSVLFFIGNAMAGVAALTGNIWYLWLGYGVVGGIGNGLGYITPIAVLIRWYPDKKGLITGLAVMGFGFGSAIVGQIAPILIASVGLSNTFFILSGIFFVITILASYFLVNPDTIDPKESKIPSFTLKEAVKTTQFYILWAALFINVVAGISLISNLAPLAQLQVKADAMFAGTIVFITSIFNGLGRLFWSAISDSLGRKKTYIIILATQIPILALLPLTNVPALFIAFCCYVLFCYGGGFAVMPSFAADTFGPKNIGSIYGLILTSWSASALIGPLATEFIKEKTNSYAGAFAFGSTLLLLGIVIVFFHKRAENKTN